MPCNETKNFKVYQEVNNTVDHYPIWQDPVTGLMWQDEPYTQQEKEACSCNGNYEKVGDWKYAKQYCKELRLGGYSDWRLPTIYELLTLLDNTKEEEPYIIDGLKHINTPFCWSSTVCKGHKFAWFVVFLAGDSGTDSKRYQLYIRAVRGKEINFDTLSSFHERGLLTVSQKNLNRHLVK